MDLNYDDFKDETEFVRPSSARPTVGNPNTDKPCFIHGEWGWQSVDLVPHRGKEYLAVPAVAAHLREKRCLIAKADLWAMAYQNGEEGLWAARRDSAGNVEAAKTARGNWAKITLDKRKRKAEVLEKQDPKPKSKFGSFAELVGAAFGDRILKKIEDPLVDEIIADRLKKIAS